MVQLLFRENGVWLAVGRPPGDVPTPNQPPGPPTALTLTAGSTYLTATWGAASDGDGTIVGYDVRLDDGTPTRVTGLSKTVTGLAPQTSHTLSVRAVDDKGSVSAWVTATATTNAAPTQATHGDQLTLADVGPAAGGYLNLTTVTDSTTLSSTSSRPSWARVLTAPETFDGVTYPAGTWVIEGVSFSGGYVTITSLPASVPHMLFRGCKFRRTGTQALQVSSTCSTDVTASYCEFGSTSATQRLQFCVRFLGSGHQTLHRSWCQWWDNALNGSGNVDIIENIVTDAVFYAGAHIDAWLCNTPASSKGPVRILRNRLEVNFSQTGCVANYQDSAGLYDRWEVRDNIVAGGGFGFYCGITSDQGSSAVMPKSCAYTGNKVSTKFYPNGGYYGVKTSDTHPTLGSMWGQNGNVWAGNTWADGPNAGQEIPA